MPLLQDIISWGTGDDWPEEVKGSLQIYVCTNLNMIQTTHNFEIKRKKEKKKQIH